MCVVCKVRASRRDVLKLTAGAAMLGALGAAGAASASTRGFGEYRVTFEPVRAEDGRRLFAIRRFTFGGERLALTVEPTTLTTMIRSEAWLEADKRPWADQSATPYLSALHSLTSQPSPTENAGLRHARDVTDGYFLTVDMCPSRKAFESRFFASLAERARGEGRAMPVAISISGYWALQHQAEFTSLIQRQRRGELDITWVNHSYSHRYVKGMPDAQNFLLMPHTDFESEVLRNEQLLIGHGLTPSVFFRFPGLVSDDYLLMELRRLSLLPLGADAWLAKGRNPKPGSIMLVHGNGNEPAGISDVRKYVADPRVTWRGLNAAV